MLAQQYTHASPNKARSTLGCGHGVAGLALGLMLVSGSVWARDFSPCLNYWHKGDTSGCEEPLPSKAKAKPKDPSTTLVVAAQTSSSQPPNLDQKIDKFLADFGKPPREFVAFYLEPNQENAVKWVHAYNEILNRPQQLAYVWTQAETLYANQLRQGVPAARFASSTMPAVKDFGIPVSGITSPFGSASAFTPTAETLPEGLRNPTSQSSAPPAMPELPLSLGGGAPASLSDGGGSLTVGAATQAVPQGPLELTYYFSAICPYCKRFTPEFADLLKSRNPDDVKLTCVDVTPYLGPDVATDHKAAVQGLKCTPRDVIWPNRH